MTILYYPKLEVHPRDYETSSRADHFRFIGHWMWIEGEPGPGPTPMFYVDQFRTIRETPKGRWIVSIYESDWAIETGHAQRHFVLDDARRRYAYPTLDLAWESFVIRQRHRLQHVRNQIDGVTALVEKIEELDK